MFRGHLVMTVNLHLFLVSITKLLVKEGRLLLSLKQEENYVKARA